MSFGFGFSLPNWIGGLGGGNLDPGGKLLAEDGDTLTTEAGDALLTEQGNAD